MFLGFKKNITPNFGLNYRAVYEYYYKTKIPKGYNWVIHHINGNHYDNHPSNLRLMERKNHDNLHKKLRNNLLKGEY